MRTVVRYTITNQGGKPVIRAVSVVCPAQRPVVTTPDTQLEQRRVASHRSNQTVRLRSREYEVSNEE